jgi:uncharacterized protein (TIGR02598 family)
MNLPDLSEVRLAPRSAIKRSPCRESRAFTLVEVCLSMTIMAFCITAIFGLLPSGLGQLNASIETSCALNISQQVLLEARQMEFPQLAKLGSYERYFTTEADRVNASDENRAYTVKVKVTSATAIEGATVDPATATLLTLLLEVRKTPSGHDSARNPAIAHMVSKRACNDLSAFTADLAQVH